MISAITVYRDSLIYVGSEESTISEFKADGDFVRTIAFSPEDSDVRMSNVQSLHASGNELWVILQNKGLCRIPLDRLSTFENFNLNESRQLHDAKLSISDTDNSLLIGCQNEIKRYNITSKETETIIPDMSASPRCLFKDRDGGLWIGVEDDGITYCPLRQNSFEHYFLGKTSLPSLKTMTGTSGQELSPEPFSVLTPMVRYPASTCRKYPTFSA